MKKYFYSLGLVLSVLVLSIGLNLTSCEGPAGDVGPSGPAGPAATRSVAAARAAGPEAR